MITLFSKIISRIVTFYRKESFRKFINCGHKQFCLVGNVTLINKNIKIGRNVTIYPNCMFYGDGPIVIGDNTSIGNNVVIYSSKGGVFP